MMNSLLVNQEAFMLIMEFSAVIQILLLISLCLKPRVVIKNEVETKINKNNKNNEGEIDDIANEDEKSNKSLEEVNNRAFELFMQDRRVFDNQTKIKIPKMYENMIGRVYKQNADNKRVVYSNKPTYHVCLKPGFKASSRTTAIHTIYANSHKEVLSEIKKIKKCECALCMNALEYEKRRQNDE